MEAELTFVLVVCVGVWLAIQMMSTVWQLELTADSLRWRSMFRSGEIPLTELQRMRARRDRVGLIESAGRRPLRVAVRAGMERFGQDVKRQLRRSP